MSCSATAEEIVRDRLFPGGTKQWEQAVPPEVRMCASCPRDPLSFAKLDRLLFRRACPICKGTRWLQVRSTLVPSTDRYRVSEDSLHLFEQRL